LLEKTSEKESQEKKKRKIAAKNAWQTIRKKRRMKFAASSKTLLEPGLLKVSEPSLASIRTKSGKRIIHKFNKTPSSIACGPFWELRWAFGCPFNCAYCYLRGTLRGKTKPRYVNIEYVLKALELVFADTSFNNGKPAIFNSGELADSWMNPQNMIRIVDKFEEQNKHKLLTLTKCGIENTMARMLTKYLRKQTITAFSINATRVAHLYETRAPSPMSRIEAATQLARQGYDIRVRIDPIFPISDWQNHYEDILFSIFAKFEPNRIILGTPRGLRKTIIFGKKADLDLSWTKYFERKETGWGWKLPFQIRFEVYQFLYNKLQSLGFPKEKISMCKENIEMWKAMKLDYIPFTCSCYGRG